MHTYTELATHTSHIQTRDKTTTRAHALQGNQDTTRYGTTTTTTHTHTHTHTHTNTHTVSADTSNVWRGSE